VVSEETGAHGNLRGEYHGQNQAKNKQYSSAAPECNLEIRPGGVLEGATGA